MATDTMTAERPVSNPITDWSTVERKFREAAAVIEHEPNDETVDVYCDARKLMLKTPAPSLPALGLKIQTLLAVDDGEEFGHAWAAELMKQTRADCGRLLIERSHDDFQRLDRLDTITRYLRRLIGSVDEELMSLSETMAEGSAGARAIADALDSTAIALEYLAEIERLSDELLRIGEPETATDCKRVSRAAVSD